MSFAAASAAKCSSSSCAPLLSRARPAPSARNAAAASSPASSPSSPPARTLPPWRAPAVEAEAAAAVAAAAIEDGTGRGDPMPGKGFYVTTAIDYLNGPPHIGHAYEKIG